MADTTANFIPCSLDDVLAYRNDRVIASFTDKFNIPWEEAERIFVEVKRWLWYIVTTTPSKENPEAHGIDTPMFIIDEMWHTFILVTRDYTAFCEQMFGRYIHHDPGFASTVEYGADFSIPEGPDYVEKVLERTMARKRAKYADIYERLGETVFLTWYREFPQVYPTTAIHRLRKR